MVGGKLGACSNSGAMTSEQKAGKSEKEGCDSFDNSIRQATGKDSCPSLPKASEYERQLNHSFQSLDEQGSSKLSKGPKVDRPLDYCNGVSSFASETYGIKDYVHSLRGSGISVKGTKNSFENMQSFKIPEAVVAIAQAAAKTNGEPEKYLHGWPLLSPMQLQKCDKCSREFCSPINYRRHIRVHRRSLNIDKDFAKNRDFLGVFWDKLSLDEAKEIVSFKDVALEEVAGSSIIKTLASFTRKLGFSSLPHVYVKAGADLLDIVQARPPKFPISSQEFFSVLDDASEKTFLCAGTALSIQKFVFDGDAGKIGLETKNLVACTSFLVEQQLVKAWIADKDAEALRCQKLLVEEEEAAHKRQAELMERKRLKKLRQKGQRAKEQNDGDKADINEGFSTIDEVSFGEMSNLPSESALNPADMSSNSVQFPLLPISCLDAIAEEGVICRLKPADTDVDSACGSADLVNSQNVDSQAQMLRESHRKMTVARRSSSKLSRNTPNGFYPVQVPAPKSVVVQKHNQRDQRAASLSNVHKVWTRKTRLGGEEELNDRGLMETGEQPDQSKCSEVLIGSISVILGDRSSSHEDDCSPAALDHCAADHQNLRQNSAQVKHSKSDASQNCVERLMVKQWRPVGRHEIGGPVMVQGDKREDRVDGISGNAVDLSSENLVACSSSDDRPHGCKESLTLAVGGASTDKCIFSSCVATAKAFLEQRWKGALAAGLVLSSQAEPPGCCGNSDGRTLAAAPSPLDGCMRLASGNSENQMAEAVSARLAGATPGSGYPKFRVKAEKGSRLKYVPRQRMNS